MFRIEASCEIERPVEEVFAYLADPARIPEWNSSVLECRVEQPGPIRVGTRIRTLGRILGRHFDSTAEGMNRPGFFGDSAAWICAATTASH